MKRSCILIGCGPSLNSIDIQRASSFSTITFNRAFIAFSDWGFHPTYYACIDRVVLPDNAQEIRQLIQEGSIERFFLRDTAARFGIPETDRVTYLRIVEGGEFSTDLKHLGMFGNVGAVSLQILASLGYRRILLVGVDGRYAQRPPNIKTERAYDYIHGTDDAVDYVHLSDNDPNHFSPRYYGKGKRENVPNVLKALDGWRRAADGCRQHAIELRNASPNSAVDCFPMVEFSDGLAWLGEK